MSTEELLRTALDAMVQANGGSKIAIITARHSDPQYYRTMTKR